MLDVLAGRPVAMLAAVVTALSTGVFAADTLPNPGMAGPIGLAALVTLAVIGVYRGLLVPGSTVDRITTLHEQRTADKDVEIAYLRESNELLRSAVMEQAQQLSELLDASRTSRDALVAMSQSVSKAS